jgi:hypothetical protein
MSKGFQKGHKISNKPKKKEKPKSNTPYPKPQAIKFYCTECHCGQEKLKRKCKVTDCDFFPYRMGKKDKKGFTGTLKPRMLAIRDHCTDCFCGGCKAKRNCPDNSCFLYPYRMGKKDPTDYVRVGIRERVSF